MKLFYARILSKLLREGRVAKGFTQDGAAKALRVTQKSVSLAETEGLVGLNLLHSMTLLYDIRQFRIPEVDEDGILDGPECWTEIKDRVDAEGKMTSKESSLLYAIRTQNKEIANRLFSQLLR